MGDDERSRYPVPEAGTYMGLFGPLHISLLLAVVCAAIALCFAARRGLIQNRAARLSLGWALALNEIVWWYYRYSREGLHPTNLPLQLCDLSVWLTVLACLRLAPHIVEFAYFAGLGGSAVALLTPDLFSPWPTYPAIYFFLSHGGIVTTVALLAFGGIFQFRPNAVWRSFGFLVAYACLAGTFNAAFGSNYAYLCRKPANPSVLDAMGPWPWYLAGSAVLAFAAFWLMWLPVRPRSRAQPRQRSVEVA